MAVTPTRAGQTQKNIPLGWRSCRDESPRSCNTEGRPRIDPRRTMSSGSPSARTTVPYSQKAR